MCKSCRYIYLSDLIRFMRQEEAVKAMNLFEGAQEHNRVSKRSLKNWVVMILSLHFIVWPHGVITISSCDFLNIAIWNFCR
jgi:hypothetical protein